jgi:hypothetical protein
MLAPADGNAAPGGYVARVAPDDVTFSPTNPDGQNSPAITGVADLIDLGPNLERLEEARPDLVNALRELVREYRQEGVVARRNEIRRIREARLFWQGMQYAWRNSTDMNWHLPYESHTTDDRALEEMPRYQFVTNFYQGFGLSFVAVISQDVPAVRFYPQSAQSLVDIAAARAASDVAELIERNIRRQRLHCRRWSNHCAQRLETSLPNTWRAHATRRRGVSVANHWRHHHLRRVFPQIAVRNDQQSANSDQETEAGTCESKTAIKCCTCPADAR